MEEVDSSSHGWLWGDQDLIGGSNSNVVEIAWELEFGGWGLPVYPVVGTTPSNAGGVGLISGQGAKILHALQPKKPKH